MSGNLGRLRQVGGGQVPTSALGVADRVHLGDQIQLVRKYTLLWRETFWRSNKSLYWTTSLWAAFASELIAVLS